MESKQIKEYIKETIKSGSLEKIKNLFITNSFDLLIQDHFIDLWEEKTINLLEILLVINRQHDFYEFNGYTFPKRFEEYILKVIRAKLLDLFEKLKDVDIETLVWLGYTDYIKKEDFLKFSEKSVMKFIENYYQTVIASEKYPGKLSWKVIRAFENKVGKNLSKPAKKLSTTLIKNNKSEKSFLIEVYDLLNLLSQEDFHNLLSNKKLNIFKNICRSLQKKSYEYHGFGEKLDKRIFEFFQETLPPSEAKALLDMQNIISEQLIIDFGYHEEIFNAYRVQNNHVEKIWISGVKLPYLPESIGDLKHLGTLDLSGSGIDFLPTSIGKLKNLRVLDLSGCNLTTLPKSFEELQKLEKLYLRGNYFDSTPKLIFKIKSLKYFDVYDIDQLDFPPYNKKKINI